MEYNKKIYGIDIETSTINSLKQKDKKISYMISYCISSLNFENGEFQNLNIGRTYFDLDSNLFKLNKLAKKNNTIFLIYIHNFDYEYSFFKNNLEFFKKYYNKNDDRSFLFMSQNSPLFIKLDNLEFRCSFKLLSKSIKKLGEELKIPKLDYEYDKIRTPLTPLTKKEIEYNFRDVEIMLKGVYKLFYSNSYIKKIKDIPLTKTGVSRLNCEKNKEVNNVVKLKKIKKKSDGSSAGKRTRKIYDFHLNKCNSEKAINEKQLRIWEQCFQGGLVFSNPKYCGVVIDNVASIDFSSSYPTQMLYRFFPCNFRVVEDKKLERLNKLIKQEFVDYAQLIQPRVFYTFFNCTIKIKNVKAKYFFYPFSISKIENFTDLYNNQNCKFINGKLIECDVDIQVTYSSLDLFILSLFYEFEITDCLYLEETRKVSKSTEYMLNACIFNGTKKVEYKSYNNLIQNEQIKKIYSKNEINDDFFRENINKCNDYIEQKEKSAFMLQSVKSDLNALYGINAMHLLHDKWSYDTDLMEWENTPDNFASYKFKRCKTSYVYGMYVACFARSSLCFIIYKLLTNNIQIYYTDTDSVKYKDCKKADNLINEFNKIINNFLIDYKFLKFGTLDKEHVYNKFVTIGTKSYISLINNNIDVKISGVPNGTRIFQDLYEKNYNYNFNDLIFECYHYDCTIDGSCINKLAHTYANTKERIKIYDKSVNKMYEEEIVSGCVLLPVSVQMKSFESKIWRSYGYLIKKMYSDTINPLMFEISTIIKKENNKYVVNTKLSDKEIF